MTQWANLLIPAGSVVAGGLVTGGLTLWGQALVNKGTHAREREARHDAFKVRQREIERDALLALQDAMSEFFRLRIKLNNMPTPRPENLMDRFHELQTMIIALGTRVPSDPAVAVRAYVGKAAQLGLQIPEVGKLHQKAQEVTGQALMREL